MNFISSILVTNDCHTRAHHMKEWHSPVIGGFFWRL